MNQIAPTKMSSKGQAVVSEAVLKKRGLKAGSEFVSVSAAEFSRMLTESHKAVQKAGITKKDLQNAIKEVRKKK